MMNQTKQTMPEQVFSTDTVFCQSLVKAGYLTHEQMLRAAQRYKLGKSNDGGVIFWEIDEQHNVRDGKIMYYHDDCHRDHERHPDWVSARLKVYYNYTGDLPVDRCLFGLHLISPPEFLDEPTGKAERGGADRGLNKHTIGIVESEKTAVICSELFPEAVWLASGGLSMLNAAKLYPLRDYKIVLFPDTDSDGKAYQLWKSIAATAQDQFKYPIRVSTLLEQHATLTQKAAKIDLVDFLYSPVYD